MVRHVFTLAVVAAAFAAAAPLQAQRGSDIRVTRGQLEVAPYAGYIFTSHFANGPFGTSLGSGNGAIYGVQAGLPLAPAASLVGGIAYSSADLKVNNPIHDVNAGTSVAWIYEGALQLRATKPTSGNVAGLLPFLQVGAGAIHRRLSVAGYDLATSTDFAMNGGVGVDYMIGENLALRLMAKDYVGKASFNNSDLATTNTLNNVALSAGLRLSF